MQDLMQTIDTSDKVFHDGNPAIGELGTIVPAKWLNNVQGAVRNLQSELLTVLGSAELASDPLKQDQLKQAIARIYAPLDSPALTGEPTAPTAAQFDTAKTLATNEFVQRALGNMQTCTGYVNGPITLTASQVGSAHVLSGTAGTLTLPPTSALPEGATFLIKQEGNGSWVVKEDRSDSGSIIYGNVGKSSISIKRDDTLLLVKDHSRWRTFGSAILPSSENFGALLASAGYQKLPSGLILQWGLSKVTASNSTMVVIFPIAFTTSCVQVVASYANAAANSPTVGNPFLLREYSSTGFSIFNGGTGSAQYSYFAIGY